MKWKKPDPKDHMLYIPCVGTVQNRQIHKDRKSTGGCQGLREGGWGMPADGDRSPCGEMEEFWGQIELVVAQHSEWTKCYLKMVKIVSFMFSECYHNFLKKNQADRNEKPAQRN